MNEAKTIKDPKAPQKILSIFTDLLNYVLLQKKRLGEDWYDYVMMVDAKSLPEEIDDDLVLISNKYFKKLYDAYLYSNKKKVVSVNQKKKYIN